ncbi:hypothetical protein OMR72_004747 [Vibrio parahaemolyticus]|uniref:hypothetical protein n=1 Tax=Vibrio parahaemolyticus TaxID=670 RepID=UPI001123673B|nr:hypothetical protein [Vibrio parahaemolyticus]EIJ2226065.1 hypothetical protein [Vibrio parahaemolyticus]EJG1014417.1 hypothetical protein [Vibrio parahaemolyticus]EJG1843332.1 hypothetical protein [Vibrio parahaemolyticus]EKA8936411.1 hypothetical protein [Vibrio parahaemolyticus]EKF6611990.1 hypothetical protein [Vibrio parahaemolyticus]
MSNIIDFDRYKEITRLKDTQSIPSEDQVEIEKIQADVKEKYLALLNGVNKSFEFQGTQEQARAVEAEVSNIIKSYEDIVVESISDIVAAKVEAYLRQKYC